MKIPKEICQTPSSKAKASTGRSIKSSHRQSRSEEMTASHYYQEMLKIEKRKLKWQRRSYRLMREYYTAKLDILKAQSSSAQKDLERTAYTSRGNGCLYQPWKWLPIPAVEMAAYTSRGNGCLYQPWKWLPIPAVEMAAYTSRGNGLHSC